VIRGNLFALPGFGMIVRTHLKTMKIPGFCRNRLFTVLAIGGWMMIPGMLEAQDQPAGPKGPPPGESPAAAPKAWEIEKIQKAIRDLGELQNQGKHEEAARLARKIRANAGDKPRVMAMLDQMLKRPENSERPGRPERPARPDRRDRPEKAETPARPEKRDAAAPKQPERPQRPMAGRAHRDIKPMEQHRMKVRHLGLASRHLEAAGYKDEAEQARKEIAKLTAEMRRAHSQAAGAAGPPPADVAMRAEMDKLRRETAELRRQIAELKEQQARETVPPRREQRNPRRPEREPQRD